MLLFPLNSHYVHKKYLKVFYEKQQYEKNQKYSGIYGSIPERKPEYPKI